MVFQKGQSGNEKGRPSFQSIPKFRLEDVCQEAQDIWTKVLNLHPYALRALEKGLEEHNKDYVKIWLQHVLPKVPSPDDQITFKLTGKTGADNVKLIQDALNSRQISISTATNLTTLLKNQQDVVEGDVMAIIDELRAGLKEVQGLQKPNADQSTLQPSSAVLLDNTINVGKPISN